MWCLSGGRRTTGGDQDKILMISLTIIIMVLQVIFRQPEVLVRLFNFLFFGRCRTLSWISYLWFFIFFISLFRLLFIQTLHRGSHNAAIIKLLFTIFFCKNNLQLLFLSFIADFFWLIVYLNFSALFIIIHLILCKKWLVRIHTLTANLCLRSIFSLLKHIVGIFSSAKALL